MPNFEAILNGLVKLSDIIKNESVFENSIKDGICLKCGMELMNKGDWIFCPKHTTDTPICDSPYHIAKNIKTGRGFCTA